jgi:SAM-dependent methyltransferase
MAWGPRPSTEERGRPGCPSPPGRREQGGPRMRFDQSAADYTRQVDHAVAFSGQRQDFFLDAKARVLEEVALRPDREGAVQRVLEVGCGNGLMLRRLTNPSRDLWGNDLSLSSLAQAGGARGQVVVSDARCAPWADRSFDSVLTICMLHHVAPGDRDAVVAEMTRLARPGGAIAICEHNPRNRLTRWAVSRCPFDRDAVLLPLEEAAGRLRRAGLSRLRSRYLLFFPWRGRLVEWAEHRLAASPLGAQYVVVGTKP